MMKQKHRSLVYEYPSERRFLNICLSLAVLVTVATLLKQKLGGL